MRFLGARRTIAEALDAVHEAGDGVVVLREVARHLVLCCPCGCGEKFPLNLDDRSGEAWRIYHPQGMTESLSVYPSIWKEDGCKSHFIVWRNEILMLEHSGPDDLRAVSNLEGRAVIRCLAKRGLSSVEDIASDLDADPWDVLETCEELVKRGALLRQGKRDVRRYELLARISESDG